MKIKQYCRLIILLIGLIMQPFKAYCIKKAIDKVQHEIDAAMTGDTSALNESILEAQKVIEDGKETILGLTEKNDQLEREKAELMKEKANLEKIQTSLTSGLIGAIVTAIVAILGVVLKTATSQTDKDKKQLEVLEKIAELKSRNIKIPLNISKHYPEA